MAIQSPCVDICRIDAATGLCVGCLRTRDEIRAWKGMTDPQRQTLIDDLAGRAVNPPPTATTVSSTS
jgi:predicted Fe-S protein YdhL (DUF1289 family)